MVFVKVGIVDVRVARGRIRTAKDLAELGLKKNRRECVRLRLTKSKQATRRGVVRFSAWGTPRWRVGKQDSFCLGPGFRIAWECQCFQLARWEFVALGDFT